MAVPDPDVVFVGHLPSDRERDDAEDNAGRQNVEVEKGKIKEYRGTMRVTFVLED